MRRTSLVSALDLEMYREPIITRLYFTARTSFSTDEFDAIIAAIAAAITTWNQRWPDDLHCFVAPDANKGDVFDVYMELGNGQLEALAEILRAVEASSAGAAISRCRVTN